MLAWYWPPVLFVILVGVVVGLYHTYLQPLGAPDITRDDYTQPFTLTSFALALLLVFRTNSSYDRQAFSHILAMHACVTSLDTVCAGLFKEPELLYKLMSVFIVYLQMVGGSQDVGPAFKHH